MPEPTVTSRGFLAWDFDGLGCAGQRLTVNESSIAFEGAHVRIWHGNAVADEGEHVQLHVDAAEAVANALLDFVRRARAGELTEPVYVEDNGHGHKPRGVRFCPGCAHPWTAHQRDGVDLGGGCYRLVGNVDARLPSADWPWCPCTEPPPESTNA